jgi:hypothetical protein
MVEENFTIFCSEYSWISESIVEFIRNDFLSENSNLKFETVVGIEFYEKLLGSLNSSKNKYGFIGWKSTLAPINPNIECVNPFPGIFSGSAFGGCPLKMPSLLHIWKEIVKVTKPFEGRMPLILKENYVTVPIGFRFGNKFSPFLKTGNEVIGWLLNGGILQHWQKYEDVKVIEDEEEGPKILLLSDLSFGFVLWLSACGISFITFLLEFVWSWIELISDKCLTYTVFWFIFGKHLV